MKLNPIIFGTSCLGNLYREIPMETKVAIAAEWFRAYGHPTIDSAGKYGAGLSLECIGKALKALGKTGNDIDISVKLGWRRSRRLAPGEEPTFEPGAWKGLEWDALQDISRIEIHDDQDKDMPRKAAVSGRALKRARQIRRAWHGQE